MMNASKHPEEGALPTVMGFGARRAIAALHKHRVPVAPLLEQAGLAPHDLENSQRLPAVGPSKLFEYAAEAINDGAFGLHLAEETDPREAGLLFYIASSAKDLGQALALFERYFRIVNEAVRLKVKRRREGAIAVDFSFGGLSRHRAHQNAEFGITVILNALRVVVGSRIRPTRVSFVHGRDSHLREFERFYGCPVEFAARVDELEFSKTTLALPLVTEDRYLLETLRPLCDEATKERDTKAGTLRSAVENEVRMLLPHGKTEKRNIAKRLGVSARTLSRRLAEEGTTYEDVVDELRRSLALQYLKDRGISFSQIAWLLGYEGATSFNHAFRRWTGRAPSVARQQSFTESQ
jgi:AraC-like DNA-binding protein